MGRLAILSALLLAALYREAAAQQPAAPRRPVAPIRAAPLQTGFTGTLEAFNTRTMTAEVRGTDGRLYLADVRRAVFEMRTGARDRAAEFIDLRPGSRLEVIGATPQGQMTAATLVRILALPARAATADPLQTGVVTDPPTVAASSISIAPAPPRVGGPVRGTLRAIDRARRILRVRVGERDVPVRYTLTTVWAGIDARSANAGYLRPGDQIRVEGRENQGEWTAERIVLEPPGG